MNQLSRSTRFALAVLAGIALTLTFEACAPAAYAGTAGVATRVTASPPAVRAEVVVVRPGPAHVWVPGHWRWVAPRRTYAWTAGAWIVPPRPRAVWVAPRHERRRGGWVYVAGRWRW